MKIIVNYPSKDKLEDFNNNVAYLNATLILKTIDQLDISDKSKNIICDKIITILEESIDDKKKDEHQQL